MHGPEEQEPREMFLQGHHHPCKQGQEHDTHPSAEMGTARLSSSLLTSGSCHHHLQGRYSCLAGVYSKGLWDFGSNSCSQTWPCNLHLAGIHNILHRNLERTAWKLRRIVLIQHSFNSCSKMPKRLQVAGSGFVDWTILILQALLCYANKTSYYQRQHRLNLCYALSQYRIKVARHRQLIKWQVAAYSFKCRINIF